MHTIRIEYVEFLMTAPKVVLRSSLDDIRVEQTPIQAVNAKMNAWNWLFDRRLKGVSIR